MPADIELCEFLEAEGVFVVGATDGSGIFAGELPAGVVDGAVLTQYPGAPPELTCGSDGWNLELPRLQLRVRHSDEATAIEKATNAAAALSRIAGDILGSVRYRSVTVMQSPGLLFRDAGNRPNYGFNIEAEREVDVVYLEGTWTPVVTLVGGAGNVVPVYTTNSGTWTRIGRLVFFNIELTGDGGAEGAGTGQMYISLPFTPSAEQLKIRIPVGTAINGANEHVLFSELNPSVATMAIYKDNVTGSDLDLVTMTGSDQNNTTRSIYLQGKILV
jgi:hypothetical protein